MDRYSIVLGKDPPILSQVVLPELPKPKKKKVEPPAIDRDDLLRGLIQTNEGRQRLAASMMQPLRQRLDLMSIARRAFRVDHLPPGSSAIYDTVTTSFALNETGEEVVAVLGRGRIPMFQCSTNQEIPLRVIRERVFDSVERAQESAVNALSLVENTGMVTVLDAITQRHERVIEAPQINMPTLMEAFSLIERNDLRVANIFMNPADFLQARVIIPPDVLDIIGSREFNNMGLMGTFLGAHVVVSRVVPANQVYVTAEAEFTGIMPMRGDLTILCADDPRTLRVGWVFFEEIGICCTNPYSVSKIIVPAQAAASS